MNPAVADGVAACFVGVLLALAGYTGWRQARALRRPRGEPAGVPEERAFVRGQAARRLAMAGLMVLLAGLIGWDFASGLEREAQQLGELRERQRLEKPDQPVPELDAAQKTLAGRWYTLWLTVTLLVMGLLALAAYDLWAVRRHGLRGLRRLQEDRRAMIERQLDRYRGERDGIARERPTGPF